MIQQTRQQSVAREHGLRAQRRRGDNHRAAGFRAVEQQEGQELGEHLVLAGLPREDDGVLLAPPRQHAVDDRARRVQLVRPQGVGRQALLRERGEVRPLRGVGQAHPPIQRVSMSTRMLPMMR